MFFDQDQSEKFQKQFLKAVSTRRDQQNELLQSLIPIGPLTPDEVLAIYQKDYTYRLAEALGHTYEAVWNVLGDQTFYDLAFQYIHETPSSFFNLNDYGKTFPQFLKNHLKHLTFPFLSDLAQFEWLFKEIFHCRDVSTLLAEDFLHLTNLEKRRFSFNSTIRCFQSPYSVFKIWKLRKHKEVDFNDLNFDPSVPENLLLHKKQQEVFIQSLTSTQFHLFTLLKNKKNLEEALEDLMEKDLAPNEEEMISFFQMLPQEGLITKIL